MWQREVAYLQSFKTEEAPGSSSPFSVTGQEFKVGPHCGKTFWLLHIHQLFILINSFSYWNLMMAQRPLNNLHRHTKLTVVLNRSTSCEASLSDFCMESWAPCWRSSGASWNFALSRDFGDGLHDSCTETAPAEEENYTQNLCETDDTVSWPTNWANPH